MKIKKGDNVIVKTGKDKGKKGVVVRAFPKTNQVLVEGVNVHKKHERAKTRGGKGAVVEKPFPINVSNVMATDSKGKATRLETKTVGTKKVRVAKTTKTEI